MAGWVALSLLIFLYVDQVWGFTSPPLILDEPDYEDLIVFEKGQAVTIPCKATGDPEVRYRWERDEGPYVPDTLDGRISLVSGTGSFIFNNPQSSDQGFYQCFASNTLGPNTATAISNKYNVRQAILSGFDSTIAMSYVRSFGSGLTIPCNQPAAFPLPLVIWTRRNRATNRFEQIDYDLRVTIDFDGQLHFANLIHADTTEYQCRVSNEFLLSSVFGPVHTVEVVGGEAGSTAPRILWQNPTNEFTTRGTVKKVKCVFSGRPTPQVEWRRTDGNQRLDDNVDREDRGQTLIFNPAKYENSGSYECRAVNADSQTPTVATIRLTVQSRPRYVPGYEPTSLTMGPGETAVFKCDGESIPRRKINWFFDSEPLNPQITARYPHYVFTETTITIPNVTEADRRSISCNITNDPVGFLFKGVYLNVLRERPEIVEPPVPRDTWAAGQSRTLKCSVFGAPRPTVSWTLNKVPLTGGRFVVDDSGNLQISKLEVTDGGEYTCYATNDLGSAKATSVITVRRRTQIRTRPVDLSVIEGAEAKFTCTAVTDADETKNLKIRWKKDGLFFTPSASVRFYINVQDNSLIVGGATPLDAGDYTCHATNGLDFDEATATLRVQGRPSPPARVYIEPGQSCSLGEVTVSWEPGPNNNAPIVNYILQYNTTHERETWYTAFDNITSSRKTQTVPLSPAVTYGFRVLARNKVGVSEPSRHTTTLCSTPDALPTKNPTGVRTLDEQENRLVITWQPVPRLDWNGEDFRYIIRHQSRVTGRCSATQEWCHHEFFDRQPRNPLERLEYIYRPVDTSPQAYEPFNIEIRSANTRGPNVHSVSVIGHSGEGAPIALVQDLTVLEALTTSYNVSLQWKAVSPNANDIKGMFRGYRVQYEKSVLDDGELPWQRAAYVIVDDSDTSITAEGNGNSYRQGRRNRLDYHLVTVGTDTYIRTNVTQLPPYTQLNFRVAVINNKYAGTSSPSVTIQTMEGSPGPVADLSIDEYGPTHVVLKWAPPLEPNGQLIKYEVGYQTVNNLTLENLQRASETNIPFTRTTTKLTGLKPLQRYRFIIWAYTEAGMGQEYFIEDSTVAPGYPGTPTMTVQRLPANNTLLVSWVAGTDGVPASVFYTQYRRDSALDAWDKTAWVSTRDFIVLDGLSDGWQYEVRVIASNGGEYETPSASTFIYPSASTRTAAEAEEVFTSAWFVALMLGLIVLAVVLILIFYIKGNKGGRYSAEERVKLMDEEPEEDLRAGFTEYDGHRNEKEPLPDTPPEERERRDRERAGRAGMLTKEKEAEGNYKEDGSYLGAYAGKELPSTAPYADQDDDPQQQQRGGRGQSPPAAAIGKPRPQARARPGLDQESVTASEVSASTAGRYYGGQGQQPQSRADYDEVPRNGGESETESEAPSQYSTTAGSRQGNGYYGGRPQQAPRRGYGGGSRDDVSYSSAGLSSQQPSQRRPYGSRDNMYNSASRPPRANRYYDDDGASSARSPDYRSNDDYDDDDDFSVTATETSYRSSQAPSSAYGGRHPRQQPGAGQHYGGGGHSSRGNGYSQRGPQPRGRYSPPAYPGTSYNTNGGQSEEDGEGSQNGAVHTVV